MKRFFGESSEQSQIKAEIVSKYFWAWANVMKKWSDRIAYIDLFAGPGRYEDGTKSTPLLILERAINDPDMRKKLVTVFNDVNSDHKRTLEKAIRQIPGIDQLSYSPEIWNDEVGDKIVQRFEKASLVPTLFFVDPWGYKGLSLRLINSVLKDWGCDCIFFFNYNRINMGLQNQLVEDHIDSLFEKARADELRQRLIGLSRQEREFQIIEDLSQALNDMGGQYVLPFCFRNNPGTRTSHYLVFVSKHIRGYEIMKDVMASQSSMAEQGVPSFAYCPADRNYKFLFEFTHKLDELGDMLLDRFSGRTLTVSQVFANHHIGRPYVKKNYREVLKRLEAEGKVVVKRPSPKSPRNSMADKAIIKFPPK